VGRRETGFMKAVSLLGYGDFDQLYYGDVADPIPADNEAGTSINPSDWKLCHGFFKDFLRLQFPAILGSDASGEVIAVGARVGQFKPGDRVVGYIRRSYAELLTAKPEDLAFLPDGMDFDKAAVIHWLLLPEGNSSSGAFSLERATLFFVTGALGLVGRTAVYIARIHGAVVIAGVRSSQKQQATSLRADQMIGLDDDHEIASLREVDAIADTVGGETLAKLLPKMKKSENWRQWWARRPPPRKLVSGRTRCKFVKVRSDSPSFWRTCGKATS
jgi:NADPH:quinone reductase-like Zn-dependent oxidoreductase